MKLERSELRNWCVKIGVEFQWMEILSLIQNISETVADSGPLIQKENRRTWAENNWKRKRTAELYWMALDKLTAFLTISFYGSEIYSDEGWTVNSIELQI